MSETYGVRENGDVLLAAGDAAWLNVLIDHAKPSGEKDGPMDWEGLGRAAAKAMLGYGGSKP